MQRGFTWYLTIGLTVYLSGYVRATPYEINYEGDVFPEEAGWERLITDGGVERSIENGILTLQAINEPPNGGSDQYKWDMQEQLNPGPGEFFFAEWRMRVLADPWGGDPQVFIAPDGLERAFTGMFSTSYFYAPRDDLIIYLDNTVFHTYRLESLDMVGYSLFIDQEWVWDGSFTVGTILSSVVLWGDGLVGSASTSQWDYSRFGVVPVPAPEALPLVVAGLALAIWINKRKQQSAPSCRGTTQRKGKPWFAQQ